jgi:hypothetical protein
MADGDPHPPGYAEPVAALAPTLDAGLVASPPEVSPAPAPVDRGDEGATPTPITAAGAAAGAVAPAAAAVAAARTPTRGKKGRGTLSRAPTSSTADAAVSTDTVRRRGRRRAEAASPADTPAPAVHFAATSTTPTADTNGAILAPTVRYRAVQRAHGPTPDPAIPRARGWGGCHAADGSRRIARGAVSRRAACQSARRAGRRA